jgi:phosphatidylserine decarboxylase
LRLDPAGFPFIGGALAIGLVAGVAAGWVWLLPFAGLALFFAFFFRDPDRRVPTGDDDAVLSPADGRVMIAGPALADATPPGTWQQVTIFLSPMNVHVNRIPVTGRVTRIAYTPGKFLPAYREDAGGANERSEIWIDHSGQTIVARQVVGVLARRVVCRAQNGAEVRAGDRFGIMKFGSRMDVFLPPDAAIRVRPGDVVRGGETIIAVLHS